MKIVSPNISLKHNSDVSVTVKITASRLVCRKIAAKWGGKTECVNIFSEETGIYFTNPLLNTQHDQLWEATCALTELVYEKLISKGISPEKARMVLPEAAAQILTLDLSKEEFDSFCKEYSNSEELGTCFHHMPTILLDEQQTPKSI